ncbi:MAG TPA: GNAT family N-acetyltransferase [Beijerinckiaceae bacterium]|nr:GNAT family N-acetyltransferase [Beijerinckiaceae bacterium]
MTFFGWFRREVLRARVAPLDARHAARLAQIHASAFARPWDAHDFERCLSERNVLADGLFLGREGPPCGFVVSRRVGDEAEILTVAIAPEARGRGHAGLLLACHLQTLLQAGVRVVHLEVEEGNAPALALYRRHGFSEVGRRGGYYQKPDGSRVSALTMSRRI